MLSKDLLNPGRVGEDPKEEGVKIWGKRGLSAIRQAEWKGRKKQEGR